MRKKIVATLRIKPSYGFGIEKEIADVLTNKCAGLSYTFVTGKTREIKDFKLSLAGILQRQELFLGYDRDDHMFPNFWGDFDFKSGKLKFCGERQIKSGDEIGFRDVFKKEEGLKGYLVCLIPKEKGKAGHMLGIKYKQKKSQWKFIDPEIRKSKDNVRGFFIIGNLNAEGEYKLHGKMHLFSVYLSEKYSERSEKAHVFSVTD